MFNGGGSLSLESLPPDTVSMEQATPAGPICFFICFFFYSMRFPLDPPTFFNLINYSASGKNGVTVRRATGTPMHSTE